MPAHHPIRLNEDERRASVASDSGQNDPKDPVARPEKRTSGRPFHRPQLLPQRHVLREQFVMTVTCQSQRAADQDEEFQHAPIVAALVGEMNGHRAGRSSGKRHRPKAATRVVSYVRLCVRDVTASWRRPIRSECAMRSLMRRSWFSSEATPQTAENTTDRLRFAALAFLTAPLRGG